MSFPRYPKYKPSGVEWLGDVPAHWMICRLKNLAAQPIKNGLGAASDLAEPDLPRYIRITDIAGPRVLADDTFRSLPADIAAEAPVRLNDILFACVGATFGKSYLHSIEIGPACYAGYLARFSPAPEVDPRFVSYWSQSVHYWAQLNALVIQSTVQNFSASKYQALEIAAPPLPEQRAIAAFLDRETATIDGLVAEQRRLIELLKEKRQAVISHAVTKGLDPKAPMKPSGVEWLGEVPAHWEVKRLEHISEFVWGKAHEQFVDDAGQHICVTARFVSTNGEATKYCTANLTPAQRGDILMVMSDLPNGRALARAFLVMDDRSYAINQRVCAVRLLQGDPAYFAMQLDRNRRLLAEDDGANQTHLSNHDFTKLKVLFPPPAEQERIGAAIGALRTRFDALAAEAESAITLLQERRSALISAAVTGQIDVRNAVATEAA